MKKVKGTKKTKSGATTKKASGSVRAHTRGHRSVHNKIPFWISSIEYFPNPGNPEENKIFLGIVLEALVESQWVVMVRARAALSDAEQATLDGIGRDLLTSPLDYIKKKVEHFLPLAKHPGDVVTALANETNWSVHFTAPEMQQFRPEEAQSLLEFPIQMSSKMFHDIIAQELESEGESPEERPLPFSKTEKYEVPITLLQARDRALQASQ
jgi:hypothetical protein